MNTLPVTLRKPIASALLPSTPLYRLPAPAERVSQNVSPSVAPLLIITFHVTFHISVPDTRVTPMDFSYPISPAAAFRTAMACAPPRGGFGVTKKTGGPVPPPL